MWTPEQIDLMRERREAAELDISFAHAEMAKAVSRYYGDGQQFKHPVYLPAMAVGQLETIKKWAELLLEKRNESRQM